MQKEPETINPFAAPASVPAAGPPDGLSAGQEIIIICFLPSLLLAVSFVALLLCGVLRWHKLLDISIGVHTGVSVLWFLQLRAARMLHLQRKRRGTE